MPKMTKEKTDVHKVKTSTYKIHKCKLLKQIKTQIYIAANLTNMLSFFQTIELISTTRNSYHSQSYTMHTHTHIHTTT